jgi:hypothetical protein
MIATFTTGVMPLSANPNSLIFRGLPQSDRPAGGTIPSKISLPEQIIHSHICARMSECGASLRKIPRQVRMSQGYSSAVLKLFLSNAKLATYCFNQHLASNNSSASFKHPREYFHAHSQRALHSFLAGIMPFGSILPTETRQGANPRAATHRDSHPHCGAVRVAPCAGT